MTETQRVIARELLQDYYAAKKVVISEFSGDMAKDYRELRNQVHAKSLILLHEDFDFGEDDQVYAHLIEDEV